MAENMEAASGLSAEAKVFIPRQMSNHGNGQVTVQQIPSYMMNCYPFVQADSVRNRSPLNGNMRGRGYHGHQGNRKQRSFGGLHGNRMTGPHINFQGDVRLPYHLGMPPPPMDVPWNGTLPINPLIPSTRVDFTSQPKGIPFDGGTHCPQGRETLCSDEKKRRQNIGKHDNAKHRRPDNNNNRGNTGTRDTDTRANRSQHGKVGKSDLGSSVGNRDQETPRTVICKEVSVQTDFPDRIADSTLQQKPSSLFVSSRSYRGNTYLDSSDSNLDSDSGYSSPLHKRNQVSNGTHPAGYIETPNQVSNGTRQAGYIETPNQVSNGTRQAGYIETPNQVSNGTRQAGYIETPNQVSNGTRQAGYIETPNQVSNGTHPAGYIETPNQVSNGTRQAGYIETPNQVSNGTRQAGYIETPNQVSNGTHQGEYIETPNQVSNGTHQAGYIETAKPVVKKISYAMAAQKVPAHGTTHVQSHSECCDNVNNNCDISRDIGATKLHIKTSCKEKSGEDIGQTEEGKQLSANNEGQNMVGQKKRRKRNRKRKKKKFDEDKVENSKDDIELHFEDEEEFPDLLGSGGKRLSREVTPGSRESNQNLLEDRIILENDDDLVMSTLSSYLPHQSSHYSANQWVSNSGPNAWGTRTVVEDTSVVHVGPVISSGRLDSVTPVNAMKGSSVVLGTPSYSEILKTKRTVTFQDRNPDEQKMSSVQKQLKKSTFKADPETLGPTDGVDQSETRATRKRRRRREMMNQAAEEELAEINLEQEMLRELNLNPKSKGGGKPAAQKPSVKESNPPQSLHPQPGILHANPQPGSGRKSKQLIALDLGAMIDALEKKKDVAENVPPVHHTHVKRTPEAQQSKGRPHNILDSSAPVTKRGKERENPKPKKPSPLKKVILKEREEKKQLRLLEENMPENTGAPVGIGVVSAESDLSQDAMSYRGSVDVGTPASNDLSPISQTSSISMSPLSPGASPLSSEVNSPVAGQIGREAVLKIHSRRFREYCNQVLNKDIDNSCTALLQDLVRFQDRVYNRDPTKAKIKRRIVLGLREVTKHLKLKKIKCVIISPNLEKIQSKGGLDDALNNILTLCNQQDIPFVFALGRRSLGRACAKLVPVSVVGIFNYEGTETNFKHLMELTEQARQSYKEMVSVIEKEIREYPTRGSAASAPHIYAHMGHSRTPSGASVLSFTSSILSEPISENYPHSEPETDSKGYEIVKDVEENFGQFNFSPGVLSNKPLPYMTKMSYKNSHKRDIDDGNEADIEDFGDAPRMKGQGHHAVESEKGSDSDSQQGSDTVEELPHIDSIHSSTYDLSTEILSQHSGRTIENCEAMSTNSSRTLGDGSSTILADPGDRSSKHDTPKSMESPSSTLQRGKVIDEERIKHWVDETQSRLENLQLQISGTEDSEDTSSESETEENSVDEIEKVTFDPLVKVESSSNKSCMSLKNVNHCEKVETFSESNETGVKAGEGRLCETVDILNDVNSTTLNPCNSNCDSAVIGQGQNKAEVHSNEFEGQLKGMKDDNSGSIHDKDT